MIPEGISSQSDWPKRVIQWNVAWTPGGRDAAQAIARTW